MRSRTIKEGSLGLFIFAGLSILGVVFIWLTGATFGRKTYQITAQFDNANGMQEGAIVRYRGLEVGRIIGVEPTSNGVNMQIEIQSPDLVIPRDVLIEANQGGLVGETSLEITPMSELSQAAIAQSPFAADCQEKGDIICNKDQIRGEIGVSFDSLLRSTVAFSDLYSDPAFFDALNNLTKNSSEAAAQITKLTQELTLLSNAVRGEVGNFAENADSIAENADSITNAAIAGSQQLTQTMSKVNELTGNLNSLVVENRQALVTTLNSITSTSDQMQRIMVSLDTTLDTVNQGLTATNTDELIGNLKTLTANAATTSENLKNISVTLNDPTNLTMLQQTLDAARVTFENTQKITSDLDELTGDPEFRKNLIDLVNGMSQLVSSTEQLQQQVQVANQIEPLRHEWSDLNISARSTAKGASKTN